MNKNFKILIIISIFVLFFSPNFIFADLGPKPTLNIKVEYNDSPVTGNNKVFGGLFSCRPQPFENTSQLIEEYIGQYQNLENIFDISYFIINDYDLDRNCYWNISPIVGSLRGIECKNSNCYFSYLMPSEFKIGIYLADENKFYLSKPIKQSAFHSTYKVNLYENGTMEVKDKTLFFKTNLFKYILYYIISLIVTIFLEIGFASWFIAKNINKAKIKRTIIYANLISLTIFWFVLFFNFNNPKFIMFFLLGEVFVFIFEWLFIYYLNKKSITLLRTFIMALVMNVLSLLFGVFAIFLLQIIGILY